MTGPDPNLTPEGEALARRLLAETREELVRVDGKAQLLLAASGVVIGLLLNRVLGSDWSPSDLAGWAQALWWLGVSAAGIALGLLGRAVFPHVTSASKGRARFFGDVAAHAHASELTATVNVEARGGKRELDQLIELSGAMRLKYRAIQAAILALAAAVIMVAASAVLG
jgi:Family of unknown function (DUF5706)